jgi:pyridoxine/pyridoxamine 5'-phosphate oxidase
VGNGKRNKLMHAYKSHLKNNEERSNRNNLVEHSMIRKSLPEIFWKRLGDPRVIFLATSDKNQPKIRPMTLIGFERRLFVHSYKQTAKIKQMKKNPRVEFCLLWESLLHWIKGMLE